MMKKKALPMTESELQSRIKLTLNFSDTRSNANNFHHHHPKIQTCSNFVNPKKGEFLVLYILKKKSINLYHNILLAID